MVREVITLPLRIGAEATRVGFRVAGQAVALGFKSAERLIGTTRGGERAGAGRDASGDTLVDVPAAPAPSRDATPRTPPRPAEAMPGPAAGPVPPVRRPAAPDGATAPEPTPAHVSREARLVEAFADPGAADGAGAAVRIEEPWKGYGQMTANEVIARLADASPEALAAVVLYERAHRGRSTVVVAAERRLRRASADARRRE